MYLLCCLDCVLIFCLIKSYRRRQRNLSVFLYSYNMVSNKVINYTNTYVRGDFHDFEYIDCSDVSGTDMYCDSEAERMILERAGDSPEGIHLIDSGNYHYMTRLFTKLIKEPYELFFFDNHTDMKPAMFDMLSCGSWAKETLEKDENLCRIVMVGPPQKSIEELPEGLLNSEKLVILSREEIEDTSGEGSGKDAEKESGKAAENLEKKLLTKTLQDPDIPLYISIDKDILDESEVKTNWDQGNIKMQDLIEMIKSICKGRRIIGADICGLFPISAGESEALSAYERGVKTDRMLTDILAAYI